MEIFKLFGSIFVDSTKAQESISKTSDKAEGLSAKLQKGIKTVGKWGLAIGGAATAAAGALLGVDKATKEYRENLAKLNTAFEANGMNAKNAKVAYDGFYKILGDNDTATESAQLLATLAQSEEDLVKWTDISAGIMGTFGDALPINSLIEAANETAKVGQVTGTLADALNWAGINEDEFNAKLAKCGTEQERNTLITETLSTTYQDATDIFRENNKEVAEAREAQIKLDETLGKLGEAVGGVKNKIMADFLPAISDVVSAFLDFTTGVDGADVALKESIKNMVNTIMEKLPDFLNFGIDVIVSIASGIIQNLPYLLEKIPYIVWEIVKAFAELGAESFKAGKEAFQQVWDGMKSIWTNISNWVSEKVNWLVDKLAFWRKSEKEMGEGTKGAEAVSGAHASGLPYVPYDGYLAQLHRGERILTAEENGNLAAQIVNGLTSALSGLNIAGSNQPINLTITIDGKEAAKALYEPLKERQYQLGGAY